MNEYDLFDAFGGIDDELLNRSEHRAVRKFPIRKALIAAAAVMLLAVTAVASPAVRKWFFGSELTEVSDANLINFPVFGKDDNGKPYKYEAFGWQEAEARVDLDLEGIGDTPDTIEELRVPTYFGSDDWTYDPYVLYPEEEFNRYIGTWQRWIQKDGHQVGQYIFYHQETIFPAAGEYPAGYWQFTIQLGNDAPVEQTTLNIDGQEFQVYQVGESELEDQVTFAAHTDVVWSDGEYAYHISTGGMELDMISDIIRSIAPAENQSEYIRTAVFDSIETYYTLSVLPEALPLNNTDNHGYYTWQSWWDQGRNVELRQQRIQNEDSDIDNRDLDFTLSDLHNTLPGSRIEHIEVDRIAVSLIWFEENVYAYWTQDRCDFTLCFGGYPDISHDDISSCITGLVPVEDFGSLMPE